MVSAGKLAAKKIAWSLATAFAVGTAAAAGCSNDKPTELVPGALSQVQVPRDLDGIELEVKANGVVKFCANASVYDGTVELPRTLGVVSGESAETIVTVTIRGFGQSASNPNFGQCNDLVNVGDPGGPQVLRRSIQTFVGQRTLFLPMALSYSCFNTNCAGDGGTTSTTTSGGTTTCTASRCVDLGPADPKAAAAKLVDFTPSLIDGTDVCFNPSLCFTGELPAIPVTASPGDAGAAAGDAGVADCTYTSISPGTGLNVKVFFQDLTWQPNATTGFYEQALANAGEVEILNEDEEEGFSVSPTNPKQFTLAPGLCDLVKASSTPPAAPTTGSLTYHTISAVHAASACPPKAALLPICAGQRTPPGVLADGGRTANLPDGGTTTNGVCNVSVPLVPTASAMYMVMDDSAVMHAAFGTQGYATAMGLSLTDPVFKRTSAGFKFLSHDNTECTSATTSFTTPDLPFELAASAQSAIAMKLAGWTAPGDTVANPKPLDLQAGMRLDAGAYTAVLEFLANKETPDVAAAMFFVNRVPDPTPVTGNDCPLLFNPPTTPTQAALTALESAARAASLVTPNLRTFFVVLDDDAHDGPTVAVPFYTQMQTELPQAVTTIDATSQTPAVVLKNFTEVVTQLGTCLYELPTGADTSTVQVSYSLPGSTAPATVIAVDSSCDANTQNVANGWNVDANGRLRICGTACTNLRNTVLAASGAALQANQPVPDVPINVTIPCDKSVLMSGDASTPSAIDASSVDGSLGESDAAGSDASDNEAAASPDATLSDGASE